VKDVRTFTGSFRAVDDERWEAVYLIDGALYKTQVLRYTHPTNARKVAALETFTETIDGQNWES
jgi:hypothetical protein